MRFLLANLSASGRKNLNANSTERLALVHPELQRRIKKLEAMLPFDLEVTQGLRTWAEQDALYAQGRTVEGPVVTDVKGGYSAHNFGYAVDVVPEDIEPGQPDWNIDHPAWRTLLEVAPSCGLAEGAAWRSFPDNPHLYLEELPAEPSDSMRAFFSTGGLEYVWAMRFSCVQETA